MKTIREEEALHRCAAYCSSAERCVQDVGKKLDRWELTKEVQHRIISRLMKEGFLDEARYCRSFVNDKSRFARWGKNKIVYALRAKGIADELIADAMEGVNPEETKENLLKLLCAKAKTVKGKDEYEVRMKLIRFAAGRGYELSLIYRCLDKIGLKNPE